MTTDEFGARRYLPTAENRRQQRKVRDDEQKDKAARLDELVKELEDEGFLASIDLTKGQREIEKTEKYPLIELEGDLVPAGAVQRELDERKKSPAAKP